jgi:hypothetical protein
MSDAESPPERIDVPVGDVLVIDLPVRIGRGYEWALLGPVDARVLAYSDTYFVPDGSAKSKHGVPKLLAEVLRLVSPRTEGAMRWLFEARGVGEANLVFALMRPWEDTSSAKTVRTVAVVVSPAFAQ